MSKSFASSGVTLTYDYNSDDPFTSVRASGVELTEILAVKSVNLTIEGNKEPSLTLEVYVDNFALKNIPAEYKAVLCK